MDTSASAALIKQINNSHEFELFNQAKFRLRVDRGGKDSGGDRQEKGCTLRNQADRNGVGPRVPAVTNGDERLTKPNG